jgi:hypothetical protein
MGMSSARLERISEALKKEVGDGKLPGAVVIVARKGKIVYSGGRVQDKGANKSAAANSIFLWFDDETACLSGGDAAGGRRRHPAYRSRFQVSPPCGHAGA